MAKSTPATGYGDAVVGLPRGIRDGTSTIGVYGTLEILLGVDSDHNRRHKLR